MGEANLQIESNRIPQYQVSGGACPPTKKPSSMEQDDELIDRLLEWSSC
jgi:hypothetical protein